LNFFLILADYGRRDDSPYSHTNQALLWPMSNDPFPRRVEKFHYWPWSYAANLFGLVIIAAGISGIISFFRRSYGSIFMFMTLSLLSMLLSLFLIAYFSILVTYYKTKVMESPRSQTMNTSYGLIGANLAFSCVIFFLGLCGCGLACCGIKGCQKKGLHMEQY
jgi:hypothetical protein